MRAERLDEAQVAAQRALDIARAQGAKAFEERAAASLAKASSRP